MHDDDKGQLLAQCDTTDGHVAPVVGRGTAFGVGYGGWGLCSSLSPSSPSREERCVDYTTPGS